MDLGSMEIISKRDDAESHVYLDRENNKVFKVYKDCPPDLLHRYAHEQNKFGEMEFTLPEIIEFEVLNISKMCIRVLALSGKSKALFYEGEIRNVVGVPFVDGITLKDILESENSSYPITDMKKLCTSFAQSFRHFADKVGVWRAKAIFENTKIEGVHNGTITLVVTDISNNILDLLGESEQAQLEERVEGINARQDAIHDILY